MVLTIGQVQAASIMDDEQPNLSQEEIVPVTVTYLDNVFSGGGWDANWFMSIQGGVSVFAGSPVGHGDFFDRTKPLLNISLGKWITPTVGIRASFQGLNFVDGNMESRSYQSIHGDIMYNVAAALREDHHTLSRWDMMPYLGIGLVHNSHTGSKPFALSLGIAGRYRLTDRLHLSGEIGGTFTARNMDGLGENKLFGDNFLNASVGLTVTIGKNGWKRVIDPTPYIYQNDQLMNRLESANGSGLNSLRARLRGKNWGEDDGINPRLAQKDKQYEPAAWNNDSTKLEPMEYFRLMKDGKIFVGTPVFFFFKLGTTELNEKAQIINLREIASVIKRYGLSARIVGAADSQTGSAYTNEKLSQKRAQYIIDLLKKQGVPEDRMEKQYRGGINSYIPMHGNRNTCVLLYFKENQ